MDIMAPVQTRQVDRFCHQYLQLERTLDVPEGDFLKFSEIQDAIYRRLLAPVAHSYSDLPSKHQLRAIKQLVSRIEASIDDWDEHGVSDDIVSSLSMLISAPRPSEAVAVQQRHHVTYHLSSLPRGPNLPDDAADITLLENRSLLSAGGTTGLRTWEAALHLGQFLCQNPSIVAGKHVLELGAGTGYLSILCVKFLQVAHVIASDGSDDVVNNLPDNFFLNQLQGSSRINIKDIKWGHALLGTEEQWWNGGRPIDVVLGADITYDQRLIPPLIGTLLDLFELYPRVEVYLSMTQRNDQTFQVFVDVCQRSKLLAEDVHFDVLPRELQDGPFYDDQVAIRIFRLSKV